MRKLDWCRLGASLIIIKVIIVLTKPLHDFLQTVSNHTKLVKLIPELHYAHVVDSGGPQIPQSVVNLQGLVPSDCHSQTHQIYLLIIMHKFYEFILIINYILFLFSSFHYSPVASLIFLSDSLRSSPSVSTSLTLYAAAAPGWSTTTTSPANFSANDDKY